MATGATDMVSGYIEDDAAQDEGFGSTLELMAERERGTWLSAFYTAVERDGELYGAGWL